MATTEKRTFFVIDIRAVEEPLLLGSRGIRNPACLPPERTAAPRKPDRTG
jgi:hypothetical protein